jgi:Sec-independent protein translocase protein TatA
MPNFMTNLSKFIKERQNATKEYQSEKQRETSWASLNFMQKNNFQSIYFFFFLFSLYNF